MSDKEDEHPVTRIAAGILGSGFMLIVCYENVTGTFQLCREDRFLLTISGAFLAYIALRGLDFHWLYDFLGSKTAIMDKINDLLNRKRD